MPRALSCPLVGCVWFCGLVHLALLRYGTAVGMWSDSITQCTDHAGHGHGAIGVYGFNLRRASVTHRSGEAHGHARVTLGAPAAVRSHPLVGAPLGLPVYRTDCRVYVRTRESSPSWPSCVASRIHLIDSISNGRATLSYMHPSYLTRGFCGVPRDESTACPKPPASGATLLPPGTGNTAEPG